jgi:N-methylhydantoinase A
VAPDGAVRTAKVLSRPADQSEGAADALGVLAATGARAGDVARVVHGTTVVTNLLLERTGARVVLCATAGHTDVLHLAARTARRSTTSPLTTRPRSSPAPTSSRCASGPGRRGC